MGEIQQAAAAEASAKGRLLRNIANLYDFALAKDRAHKQNQHSAATGLPQISQDTVLRDVAAEVGVALMLPAGSARAVVEEALVMTDDLPHVLETLEEGAVTWPKARLILHEWRALMDHAPASSQGETTLTDAVTEQGELVLPDTAAHIAEEARALTRELLIRAADSTVRQLGDFARRRRAKLGAAAHQRACATAKKQRDVWITPADDGLACLTAMLDAPTATAIHTRLNRMVETLGDSDRLKGEKRADVLSDLLLDGELPASSEIPRGIRGHVSVTVPATDLIAHDPDLAEALDRTVHGSCPGGTMPPASPPDPPTNPLHSDSHSGDIGPCLVGYGAISTADALHIAAGAPSWRRLLTHQDTGVITEYGRATYAVPAGLRRLLAVRDETCRFPGCRRMTAGCDVDHAVAWEIGGRTDAGNLAHLCRLHHRIKHDDGALGSWSVRHIDPDVGLNGMTETASDLPEPMLGALPVPSDTGNHGQQLARDLGVLEWTSPTGIVRRTVPSAPTAATTRWLVGTTRSTTNLNPPHEEAAEDPPPF